MNNNTKNTTKLELLAPAKDFKTAKTAILAGADAVYIGAPKFGARSAAGNSWEDIKELIDFSHQYYVKVYVALNTIFFDNEASLMKKSLEMAYEIGVDAAIIQDMGILEMENLPPLPLFASTQCHNYKAEQIKFLAKAGFSRIILARELNLQQIKELKKQISNEDPTIGLEFFVHGALCVSFSGRCYMSQAIAKKSANRGECIQACRTQFDLIDSEGKILAKDKFLLSLRDLNLSEHLTDLIKAGITSFKIEGRLKDQSYVGNVTAEYRRLLDEIIDDSDGQFARASSGRVKLSFIPDLQKTFNRGYTEYFISKCLSDIVSPDSQKALGKLIGVVKECTRDYFVLKEKNDLKNGDGICWFADGKLQGININKVDNKWIFLARRQYIASGTKIYRNQDLNFEKTVIEGAERKIAVDFIVEETKKGFSITVQDEDNNKYIKEFVIEKSLAKKTGQENLWREQFSRLGESIFSARNFTFILAEEFFVPMSVLNEWRRKLIAGLEKERIKNYPRQLLEHKKTNHQFLVDKINYSYNIANALAKNFYTHHGAEVVEEAMEKTNETKGRPLMITKHCLKYWLNSCPKKAKAEIEFKEPLYLVQNGKKYKLKFDCQNCQMEFYNQ